MGCTTSELVYDWIDRRQRTLMMLETQKLAASHQQSDLNPLSSSTELFDENFSMPYEIQK